MLQGEKLTSDGDLRRGTRNRTKRGETGAGGGVREAPATTPAQAGTGILRSISAKLYSVVQVTSGC